MASSPPKFIMAKLWVFLLAIVLSSFSVSSSTNSSAELLALLSFKAHITSDPFAVLSSSWKSKVTFCNWTGVSCSPQTGRVTSLILPDLSLGGTIAPEIANLTFLRLLDLSNNTLSGDIPVELKGLRRLTSIRLSHNGISGAIPEEFGSLQALQELSLSHNDLTGNIPGAIFNISTLQTVTLSHNMLSGNLPSFDNISSSQLQTFFASYNRLGGLIPLSLANFRQLQLLSFSGNYFYGSLPESLGSLPKLQSLYFAANNLTGVIPRSLGNLSQLAAVDLSNNRLFESIPEEFGRLSKLQFLLLDLNDLTGELPAAIYNMSCLQVFTLENNLIQGNLPSELGFLFPLLQTFSIGNNNFIGNISASLSQCKNLQQLSLEHNYFSGAIPMELGYLPQLRRLSLAFNYLTGSIPLSLANLTRLLVLDLQNNNLKGSIPQQLKHLLSLQTLNLAVNELRGEIPRVIFNMTSLVVLDLSHNSFSGKVPSDGTLELPYLQIFNVANNCLAGEIPRFLFNSSKLNVMDLSFNDFIGTVPVEIGKLPLLQHIYLHHNQLTGGLEFISALSNCRFLQVFQVDVNQFGSHLPKSVGNLSDHLQEFIAIDCNLEGTIPDEFGNLSNLMLLYLDQNKLHGIIPASLTRLEKLQRLHLCYNNLEGRIPEDLYRMTMLGDLYLIGNMLEASIPDGIGNTSALKFLDISSNKLSYKIPRSISNLQDLIYFNSSHNFLTGAIPAEIGAMKMLTALDLSVNQFSGDIPSSLGGLEMLGILFLSNNSLTGSIPNTFGSLISMVYMDLSCNALSGDIPGSLANLQHLIYLNLSFNRLQGRIPDGRIFANLTAESLMGNLALCGATKLGVPSCNSNLSKKSRNVVNKLKYILPIVGVALLGLSLYQLLKYWRKNHNAIPSVKVSPVGDLYKMISYQELLRGTNNFNEVKLLGVGGFCKVFKGELGDSTPVAVKVFNLPFEEASKSFDAECLVLRKVRHRNLVKVISSCSNLEFRALVLQFVPNGSLEKWLYSHNYYLNLLQRLSIMLDVAQAMEYLHHECPEPVIHCDLKPSNVLLDKEMTAYVSDFGIAKLLLGEATSVTPSNMCGTVGYIPPEYGHMGRVSTRGDVYSYGILLLETFIRRRPTDAMFTGEMSLRVWVSVSFPDAVMDIIDTNLLSDPGFSSAAFSCIIKVGLSCVKDLPRERINMKEVVLRLTKIKKEITARRS